MKTINKEKLINAIKTHKVFVCNTLDSNKYYFIKQEDIKTNLFYKLNIYKKLLQVSDIQDLACDCVLENEHCYELHKKFADDIVKEFPALESLFKQDDLSAIDYIIALDKDYVKENIADKVENFIKEWRSKNEVHYETEYFTYDEEDYPISDLLYTEISDDEKNSIISDIANLDTIKEECDYKINKLQKELDAIDEDIQQYEHREILFQLNNAKYEKENANDDEIDVNIDFEFYNSDLYDIDYNDYNFAITIE